MLKTKIFSIGNKGKNNYIIINKNRDTFKWLGIVFQLDWVKYAKQTDSEEYVGKADIKKFIDTLESSYLIDKKTQKTFGELILFYGKDKIYLTFECPIKYRKKIFERMEDISYWKKTTKS